MLQVKNLPEELHAALAERARSQGVTMSEYVTRLLRRDLARPTIDEWLAERRSTATPPRRIDVMWALEDARVDYDHDDQHNRGEGAGADPAPRAGSIDPPRAPR